MIRAAVVMAVLASFGPRDPEHNGPPTAADTTLMWLGALRDGRAIALAAFTAFPFSYREAWSKKRCAQIAPNADALARWVECTHEKESRFIDMLRSARTDPKRVHLAPGMGRVGPRLRALAEGSAGRSTWLNGSIKADRVTYEFLFAVSGTDVKGRRIAGMFIDSSAEPK
jgi:hypothetical protein